MLDTKPETLNVRRKLDGKQLGIELLGTLNESAKLSELIEPVPARLVVNCRQLHRINSVGALHWVSFFGKLRSRGVTLRFQECSHEVVNCLNCVAGFVDPREVESLSVPFYCRKCKKDFSETVGVEEIKRNELRVAPSPCPDCDQRCELDEDESQYFAFLK